MLAIVSLPIALALAGGSPGGASAAGSQTAPRVPGELIVGFEAGATPSAQNAAVAQAGGMRAAAFPQIRAVLVRVPASLTERATKYLLGHPRVRYVEPNHVVRTVATIPNDPSFSQLWGLSNSGQTGGTPDADIDAPEAWDVTTGSSDVVVGVTDTGVDFGHPDLAQQQWVNAGENCGSMDATVVCADRSDGVDDDGNSYVDDWRGWDFANDDNNPFDDHNHGTHVAGTIGAVGNNGVGVAGVSWNVKIMALKILNAAGSGTTADAIAATLYSADRGAHISSNSWGGGPVDQSLLDAIEYGAARNMLFVAAAGNDGQSNDTTPFYPANYGSEAIVSVAATDHNEGLAFFSNYGASTVDLGAPGVNIVSTTPGNTYQSFNGTSMATPHVSGVAALLRARFPSASLYGLKTLLLRSVDPKSSLAGRTTTGGRLNAFGALSCEDSPRVWLDSPSQSFVAGVGDTVPVNVLATSCASPAGLASVSVTVNGDPVALTASSPDRGLYSGSFAVSDEGPLNVVATVTVGGSTAVHTATGAAFENYTCEDVPFSWVDVTPGTKLNGAGVDDGFATLAIGFPVSLFGQTSSTAYVSSNGFLTLGSNAGAGAHLNAPIPNSAPPNGVVAPFWDDLNPGQGGAVYAGVTGSAPNRALHVEWFNVPHFSLSGSGTVTFEATIWENGAVRFQYLDTDFGNSTWNAGASATSGVEQADGVIGRQSSFNQPLLTNGRAVTCSFDGEPPAPTPPTAPTALSASAGDGAVDLAWGAPSSDGGSQLTGYRVYRGQAPGTGSHLADVPSGTSFEDETVVNGVTYYYRVSASNAVGEGPLSSEVSATPAGFEPPFEPLTTLDTFNRADENPLSDGGRWGNGVIGAGEGPLRLLSGQLAGTKTTTTTGWRTNASYGPDVEVWTRLTTLPGTPNSVRLYARLVQPGSGAADGYMLRTMHLDGTDQVLLERLDNGVIVTRATLNQELATGDRLLLRVQGSTLEAWRHDGSSWTRIGGVTDTTYPATGFVGVGIRGTSGLLDDFGARRLPVAAPTAPTALSASAGDGAVDLAWGAPSSDGGSQLTGYRVYRGQAPGTGSHLADVPSGTSFEDETVVNGVTYYYRVSASNAVGEGPLSSEVSATPAGFEPPFEPLTTLDTFNRADENPLSDGGRWGNGVIGAGEGPLRLLSGQLAGTKTTTTTGWRTNASYGPDVEVWTRLTTLPGTPNSVRLYARLVQPGSGAADGYMLRTMHLDGTDQVLLERLDNGVIVTRATLNQELATGDRLLLRVQGSTLEAWRHDGSSWTRIGGVTDTTYPATGFVGVGIRGTSGLLDDFGARRLPVAAPTAPTALSASAGDGAVDLAWGAPSSDGGSQLTGYRVYRGQAPGTGSHLADVPSGTSFEDETVVNGVTYYYRVSASNAVGEGPLSSEVSATPAGFEPPFEPLTTLDTFNRADENPLSDGGRWGNGVIGAGEGPLRLLSGQLAGTKTTTTTGWRTNASYGPDVEVWTRLTTLPGTPNSVRLYARLVQPGSGAADGYMLRTMHLDGTDQVLLERLDNGVIVTRATLNQELATGDRLLLRVQGSTLEAWRHDGSSWTRIGGVTDTTYPATGFVGVGIRGTSGLLDDFGARRLG